MSTQLESPNITTPTAPSAVINRPREPDVPRADELGFPKVKRPMSLPISTEVHPGKIPTGLLSKLTRSPQSAPLIPRTASQFTEQQTSGDMNHTALTGSVKRPSSPEFIQPYSPKRQRSLLSPMQPPVDMLSESLSPSSNFAEQVEFNCSDLAALGDAYFARIDNLLWPNKANERWPPLVVNRYSKLHLHRDPPSELLRSLLESQHLLDGDVSNRIPSGITLALTTNLHLHVHRAVLHCCSGDPVWCFSSLGFALLGQEEIVIVTRRESGGESLPPLDVCRLYAALYDRVTRFSDKSARQVFRSMDCFTHGPQFPGCVFFRPTNQHCLRGMTLPAPPFLVALLIDQSQDLIAQHLPLRVLLHHCKQSNVFPVPLVSARSNDMPVLRTSGIVSHLANNCDAVTWESVVLRVSTTNTDEPPRKQLLVLLPRSVRDRLSSVGECCDLSKLDPIVLRGVLDSQCDSYLTCSTRSDGKYVTEAVTVSSSPSKVVGCCFAIVSTGATQLSVCLLEDGLLIRMSDAQLARLLSDLNQGSPVSFMEDCSAERWSVLFRWSQDDVPYSENLPGPCDPRQLSHIDGQRVPVDRTFNIPLPYQLFHWKQFVCQGKSECGFPRVIWSKLHFLSALPKAYHSLPDKIARLFVKTLSPYAAKLRAHNHVCLTLRLSVAHPDRVGYQLASQRPWHMTNTLSNDDFTELSACMESKLTSTIHDWMKSSAWTQSAPQENPVIWQLDFNILD